ncbi:MAG: hypothetical protein P8Y23_15365, partial [Candidatus Lokiarchaeota archaeon]
MSDILTSIHAKAFILNPNLGHPLFLRFDKALKTKRFEITLLCASNVIDELEIEKIFKGNIELIPLFEYKWKLRQLIEEENRKQEKRIKESIKEKHFWQRILLKISKKRRRSFEEEITADFKKKIESYE